MGQFSYNPLNGNLDFSSNGLEAGTLEFMGNISVASDFPTPAQVQENDIYRVLVDVTDNDGTKTNTGQSFVEGDEIMWDGVAWEILGNYVSLLGTSNTWTGTNTFDGLGLTDDITMYSQGLIKDATQPTYNQIQLRNSSGNFIAKSQVGMYFVLDADNTNSGSFNICDETTGTARFTVDYTGAMTVTGNITQTSGTSIVASANVNTFFTLDSSGNTLLASRGSINNYIDYDANTTATSLYNIIADASGVATTIFSAREDGVFTINYTNSATNVFTITGTTLSTGSTLRVYDNSADTSVRRVIFATNDHASATGCIVFHGQQDSTADGVYLDKNDSGNVINIDLDANNASACYGMVIDIVNAGAGLEYAFRFNGSEVSSNRVRVSLAGTDYFMPFLNSSGYYNDKLILGNTDATASQGSALVINSDKTTGSAGSASLLIQGSSGSERIKVYSNSSIAGGAPLINMFAFRGTLSSPTATQNGDIISGLSGGGYGSSQYSGNYYTFIQYATENWTNSANGCYIAFFTVPNGTTSLTGRLLIDHDGSVTFGSGFGVGTGAIYAGTGTFAGLLTTVASASGGAGLRIPHGAAPSSPTNGDMWTTTSGLFVRINGVTKTVTLT